MLLVENYSVGRPMELSAILVEQPDHRMKRKLVSQDTRLRT